MRHALLATCLTLVALPVHAQITARLTVGASVGTPLVEDVLGDPVSLGAGVPPTLALSAWHPIAAKYRAGLEARVGRGSLKVDDGGVADDLEALTTVGLMFLVDGPFAGGFRWEVGAGIMSYRPADEAGVFSQGGPSPWMLGGGLTWTRPLGSTMRLAASGRYDFHQFRTRQLESRGYTQFQTVHRIGLGIGVERTF